MIQHLIRNRISYVDTLQVRLRRCLTPQELSVIRGTPGCRLQYFRTKHCTHLWPRRLLLQQPTAQLLRAIGNIVADHRVNRLDVALDYITKTDEHAQMVDQFLRQQPDACLRHRYSTIRMC